MQRIITLLYFIFSTASLFAFEVDSTKTSDSTKLSEKQRKLKIGIDYTSDNSFNGRKGTVKTPMLSPLVKYTARSGFYTEAAVVSAPTTKSKNIFDELDAGVGWLFDFSDNWDGSASYTHYVYASGVSRLRSSLQNDVSLSAGFDWDILYSRLIADYYLSDPKTSKKGKIKVKNSKDYNITVANMHDFDIKLTKNSMLTISPEADVLFGTQNFLAAYKGKTDTSKYAKQASSFTLTSYLFYLDVKYRVKNFSILLSPSYTIPQNVPEGESATPYFIMSASVYYTFKSKDKQIK